MIFKYFVTHLSNCQGKSIRMSDFGERIKEERRRLKLGQDAFGEAGGVKKQAQFNYEKGERFPDVRYLAGIDSIGADVLYIITNRRQSEPAKEGGVLASKIGRLSVKDRDTIEYLVDALVKT